METSVHGTDRNHFQLFATLCKKPHWLPWTFIILNTHGLFQSTRTYPKVSAVKSIQLLFSNVQKQKASTRQAKEASSAKKPKGVPTHLGEVTWLASLV